MSESFKLDLTPVGGRTEEGAKRINDSMRKLEDARAEVANLSASLLREHDYLLKAALKKVTYVTASEGDVSDALEAIHDLQKAVNHMKESQEEFFYALAGKIRRPAGI